MIVTDARVVDFVEARIGKCRYPCTAVGLERDGNIVAWAIYERNNGHNIIFHGASDGSRRWATRGFIRALVAYPFITLNLPRMSTPVAASNVAALEFDRRLGFRVEGVLRQAANDGSDLVWLGLFRKDCKWLSS